MKDKPFLIILLFFIMNVAVVYGESKASDWISDETVASVVKLSSLLKVYTVEGLADDYKFKTVNGKPDFGGAEVLLEEDDLVSVGTGVIVTPQGLIITNAHVFGAYIEPEIVTKKNPAGKPLIGKSGKTVKYILVNQYPDHMFVGLCDVERLKKNDEKQRLAYVAEKIMWDSDYDDYIRDRAVLQIVNEASMNEKQVPVIGKKCDDKLNLPYSRLSNPFEHDYLEKKVRAVGFPGVGDPNRSSKTSGELLGYEDEATSNILHTSWISNGNSGGGLFYKDTLIGINTWDNQSNPSRPVAIAQPNTYWNEAFAYTRYIFPEVKLPAYSFDWIKSDPSTEKYKDEVFVSVQLVHKEKTNKSVRSGLLVVFRDDITKGFLEDYIEKESQFKRLWDIIELLWKYNIDEVLEKISIDRELAYKLRSVTKRKELRQFLEDDIVAFYDLWCSNEFVYDVYKITDNGKAVLTVPKNSKLKLIYLYDDDTESKEYSLSIKADMEQGPFTIKIGK